MLRELVGVGRRDFELLRALRDLLFERSLIVGDLALRFGEPLRHVVERMREQAKLIGGLCGHIDVEPARAHSARRAHEPTHRRDQPAGEKKRRNHRDDNEQTDDRLCVEQVVPKILPLSVRRHAKPDVTNRRPARRRRYGCHQLDNARSAYRSFAVGGRRVRCRGDLQRWQWLIA